MGTLRPNGRLLRRLGRGRLLQKSQRSGKGKGYMEPKDLTIGKPYLWGQGDEAEVITRARFLQPPRDSAFPSRCATGGRDDARP